MHFDTEEHMPMGIPIIMYFAFISPECHWGKLLPGKEFQLRDGPKIIGNGRILRLIDLEESANTASQSETYSIMRKNND